MRDAAAVSVGVEPMDAEYEDVMGAPPAHAVAVRERGARQ
jgi:hypothetical protein